ncbi:MAM domain family protein [Brugia pahangi]
MRLTVTFFTSILSKVVNQINTSADLNCGFESACQWRNITSGEDSGDFLITSNVRVANHFNIIPSRNNSDELFAYTHGPFDGMQKATLISNIISCQLGGSTLKFWYYRTGDSATLEVCVRQPPGSLNTADLRCFPVFPKNYAHQWLFNAVEFPPLTQPFELLIRSNYIQPFDIMAIDDIFYDAVLCENTNSRSTEGGESKLTFLRNLKGNFLDANGIDSVNKNFISFLTSEHRKRLLPVYTSSTSRKSISKLTFGRINAQLISPCLFTDCSFDSVNMCNYVSSDELQDDDDLLLDLPSDITSKKWRLSNQKVANTLTGIMSDVSGGGWFIYAGETNNPAAIFLMRTSKAINIPEESQVSFYVHMAGKYGRIRVCLDSLQKCSFERNGQALSVKTRKWINFHVNISRGFHTIYFVADKLKKNYVIGLDKIQLLIKHGEVSAPCAR